MTNTFAARQAGLTALTLALTYTACDHVLSDPGGARAAPYAPPPFSGSIEPTTREAIVGYARSLQFDTTHIGSDTRRITVQGQLGPLATIQAVHGYATQRRGELREGRIIARITSDAARPEIGVAQGTTYWWVHEEADQWVATMIPEDPRQPIRTLPMRVSPEHGDSGRRSAAQWRWDETSRSDVSWAACGNACCKPKIQLSSGAAPATGSTAP